MVNQVIATRESGIEKKILEQLVKITDETLKELANKE